MKQCNTCRALIATETKRGPIEVLACPWCKSADLAPVGDDLPWSEETPDQYLDRLIQEAAPAWEGVDLDEFMNMVRGQEFEPPKRIQRKRTKGWRMPENTVYVGRPGKWGNPFFVGDQHGTKTVKEAVESHRQYMMVLGADLSELKGKDLACWCPIGEPCHADTLLQLANEEAKSKPSNVCNSCGNDPGAPHLCPNQGDEWNDWNSTCNCCPSCMDAGRCGANH